MSLVPPANIFQNAWVVDDLEHTCHDWIKTFGIGPFFITEYPAGTFKTITYRGQPADLSMRVALAQAGPVQIELIEPWSSPSVYRDSVPAGSGSTMHHLGAWSDDFEGDLIRYQELGCEAITIGKTASTNFAYLDTRAHLGCMLEIVTKTSAVQARFAKIAAAAENWSGERPLRD